MKKLCIVFNKNWEPSVLDLCTNDIIYLKLMVVEFRFRLFRSRKRILYKFDPEIHFYDCQDGLLLYNPYV